MAAIRVFYEKDNLFKIVSVMLIILFTLFFYKETIGASKIETIKELEQLISIDLSNDYDCIYDVYSEIKNNETEVVIYYEITQNTLNKKRYYQYNIDYNPLPSQTEHMTFCNIEKYLNNFKIIKDEIIYMNCEFYDCKVENFFGTQSRPIEVNFYIMKYEKNENIKVILSTFIPCAVEIDIENF